MLQRNHNNGIYRNIEVEQDFYAIQFTTNAEQLVFGIDEYFDMYDFAQYIDVEGNGKIQFLDKSGFNIGFLRFEFNTFTYRFIENLLEKDDTDIIGEIQKGLKSEYFMHLPSQIGSFLHKIAIKPAVLEEFMK